MRAFPGLGGRRRRDLRTNISSELVQDLGKQLAFSHWETDLAAQDEYAAAGRVHRW
jgi:hypothetical protein